MTSRVPHVSTRTIPVLFTAILLAVMLSTAAQAHGQLIQLSTDTFTNTSSQHMTEVEPDTFAYGNTIVSAFQVGRISSGGSSDIGFATSTDGGVTWTNGFLPGLTIYYQGGQFSAASDPAVAYDPVRGKWMIVTLGLGNIDVILVSTSSDGIHWNNPVTVNNNTSFADKTWIRCDSNLSSPFAGNCYAEWDDAGGGDQIKMSRSTDGGNTWSAAVNVPSGFGLGGQPVTLPNGTVVVPFEGNGIQSFTSTDGGLTWNRPVTVSSATDHFVAGNLRTEVLPSAEVDGAGNVYVAWQDCRFRSNCSSNDIVYSTSANGTSWSAVKRVPIDPTSSTLDHFIPGIAVDPSTSGANAHVAVTFYFYPVANCASSCSLNVGFISSQNGGTTWSRPLKLAGPMRTTWLPNTTLGRMVGDYISTSYVNGNISFGVFARALQPNGSVFREAMFTAGLPANLLAGPGVLSSAGEVPVPNAHSDHGPSIYLDHEGRLLKPPADRD